VIALTSNNLNTCEFIQYVNLFIITGRDTIVWLCYVDKKVSRLLQLGSWFEHKYRVFTSKFTNSHKSFTFQPIFLWWFFRDFNGNLTLIYSLLSEKQTATIIEVVEEKRFMDTIILDNKKWIKISKNNRSFIDISYQSIYKFSQSLLSLMSWDYSLLKIIITLLLIPSKE